MNNEYPSPWRGRVNRSAAQSASLLLLQQISSPSRSAEMYALLEPACGNAAHVKSRKVTFRHISSSLAIAQNLYVHVHLIRANWVCRSSTTSCLGVFSVRRPSVARRKEIASFDMLVWLSNQRCSCCVFVSFCLSRANSLGCKSRAMESESLLQKENWQREWTWWHSPLACLQDETGKLCSWIIASIQGHWP